MNRSEDGEKDVSESADSPIPMDSSANSETSEIQGRQEEEAGNDGGIVGQVTDEGSNASEQVLNPNQNENLDAQASSQGGHVEDEVGEAVQEMAEGVPEVPEQVLDPNQNENMEDDQQSPSSEGPVGEAAAGSEMTDASDPNHYHAEPQDVVDGLSSNESGGERPSVGLGNVPIGHSNGTPMANTRSGVCGCSFRFGARPGTMTMIGCNGLCGTAIPATPSTPPTTMLEVIDWERVEGTQAGLPRLPDTDALRHALAFLRATELAHFCRSSTSARDVVSNHAALEMVNRFPTLRIGVREPPHPLSSLRRLAFACPSTSPASTAGPPSAPMGAGHPYQQSSQLMAQLQLQHVQHQQQASIHHSDLWDKEVVVGNVGSPTGSPVTTRGYRSSLRSAGSVTRGFLVDGTSVVGASGMSWRRRHRGSGLARYDRDSVERALPSLHYLELCGDLLLSQQKTLPRYDLEKEFSENIQ